MSADWDMDYLLTFFQLTGDTEIHDCFWWRTDGGYAPITIFANCNDLFYWACADVEELTPDNIWLLGQAIADIRPFVDRWRTAVREFGLGGHKVPQTDYSVAVLLFCARARNMRPQGAYYQYFIPGVAELFDAAGPVRTDPGDTTRKPWYRKQNV